MAIEWRYPVLFFSAHRGRLGGGVLVRYFVFGRPWEGTCLAGVVLVWTFLPAHAAPTLFVGARNGEVRTGSAGDTP